MLVRQTTITANVVQFCRYLRTKGYTVGAFEEQLALLCLPHIDIGNRHELMLAWQALLCRSLPQVQAFAQHFNNYWKEVEEALNSKTKTTTQTGSKRGQTAADFNALKAWLHGNYHKEVEEVATYSHAESFTQKNFAQLSAAEVEEMLLYLKALARRLAARNAHRFTYSPQPARLHLRQMMRRNLCYGGEWLHLAFKKQPPKKVRLVVLADVSQSMALYSRFLLTYLYGMQRAMPQSHCFAFGTALQYISPLLSYATASQALEQLAQQPQPWFGGTRIGSSLQQLCLQYEKYLHANTTVIILSDGWDAGEEALITYYMHQLHRQVKKIIWLNPLAGNPAYKPQTQGMVAALPFIDVLAPAHNAKSLANLQFLI